MGEMYNLGGNNGILEYQCMDLDDEKRLRCQWSICGVTGWDPGELEHVAVVPMFL